MSAGVAAARPSPIQASSTELAAVVARAGEAEAEAAGDRGLGPAGVGRAVVARVAPQRAPAGGRRRAGAAKRGREEQERGEAGREPVDEVVEARGEAAEVADSAASGGRSCCPAVLIAL